MTEGDEKDRHLTGGTIPALLTPFTAGGAAVQPELMVEHVTWLAGRGIRTVSAMGTTGEGASLSLAERKRTIDLLADHPSGIEMQAATGCTALPETIELTRYALERGAVSVLVAPPSYFQSSPPGTTAYFVALFESLPTDARVFLYHIPSVTGVPIEDETFQVLGDRFGPMLAGAKDSSGDIGHCESWLRAFPELTILPGSDAFAARAYAAGVRGTITLLANVFPRELEGIRAGVDVARRQRFLATVRELVEDYPRHAAVKHLLHVVSGLPRSSVRPPLEELTVEQAEDLEARFGAA